MLLQTEKLRFDHLLEVEKKLKTLDHEHSINAGQLVVLEFIILSVVSRNG